MQLEGKKVIAITHQDFEDLELWYPVMRLREEGANVDVASEKAGIEVKGKHGVPIQTVMSFPQITAEDYDALVIPGGWAPDKLRRFEEVLKLVRKFDEDNKPIAQICHAGWILASACILKGRTVTSTPGIKDDMINAGANWVDESSITDGNIISAQRPPDLPNFMRALIHAMVHQEKPVENE